MARWVGGGVSACRMENPSARDCVRTTLGDVKAACLQNSKLSAGILGLVDGLIRQMPKG